MLSRRIIIVAEDKALQRRLIAGAMAAGGAVQAFRGSDELPPRLDCDLCLYALPPLHPASETSLAAYRSVRARLVEGARLCPVLSGSDLAATVTLLADDRVEAVISAHLDAGTISATIARLFWGDLFGLQKAMPWGVRIYSSLVGDYHDKAMAIASVADFAEAMGVRKKYRDQIEQCLDEMLMNALYDAPVDANGQPLYAEVSVKERIGVQVSEKVILQYACDGERFALSVRDRYGSLRKETIVAYLDKCLHARAHGHDQIDHKASGAGLGLFLIANSASQVSFHIFPGQATEVLCLFELTAARSQLQSLCVHLGTEGRARDWTDDGRAPPQRRRSDLIDLGSKRSRLLPIMMGLSLAVLVVAITVFATFYRRTSILVIDSEPPGATILVDGLARGLAPLRLTDLEPGRSYALHSTLVGRRDDTQNVTAVAGESRVRLRNLAGTTTVRVESEPPDARIAIDAVDSGKVTPAELDLTTGKIAALTLTKPGYRDEHLDVTGPASGERRVYSVRLPLGPEFSALGLDVEPREAALVMNVSVDGLLLMPPAAHYESILTPDTNHHVRVSAPGFVDHIEDLTLHGGERRALRVHLDAKASP